MSDKVLAVFWSIFVVWAVLILVGFLGATPDEFSNLGIEAFKVMKNPVVTLLVAFLPSALLLLVSKCQGLSDKGVQTVIITSLTILSLIAYIWAPKIMAHRIGDPQQLRNGSGILLVIITIWFVAGLIWRPKNEISAV